MKTIIHTVRIHASPQTVYGALTTEAGVTGWWSTRARLDPGESGIIKFTFVADFHPHMNSLKQLCETGAGAPFKPTGE